MRFPLKVSKRIGQPVVFIEDADGETVAGMIPLAGADILQDAETIVDAANRGEKVTLKRMAATLGKRGGQKGGEARAKKLSAERRREIASKAACVRWSSNRD